MLRFQGVNYAGAEFWRKDKPETMPGIYGKDYIYPRLKPASNDPPLTPTQYFAAAGVNLIRLPIRQERVQPKLFGPLDADEIARLDASVAYMNDLGITVMLDPHNYFRFVIGGAGHKLGSETYPASALVDFWIKLAAHFKDNPRVVFDTNNEPNGLPAEFVAGVVQQIIDGIRSTGAKQTIYLEGTSWTGMHSWFSSGNAAALEKLTDPENNLVWQVHQYPNSNYDGIGQDVVSATIFVEKAAPFEDWLQERDFRGFLGEFNAFESSLGLVAIDKMIARMVERSDVWDGYAMWAAGDWWGNYFQSVHPIKRQNEDGSWRYEDQPQFSVMKKYLALGTGEPGEPPVDEDPPPGSGDTGGDQGGGDSGGDQGGGDSGGDQGGGAVDPRPLEIITRIDVDPVARTSKVSAHITRTKA